MFDHPERRRHLERLFHAALEATDAERAALLEDVRQEDLALHGELVQLLTADRDLGTQDDPVGVGRTRSDDVRAARPDRIGAYLILDELGEGGMGTVYRAQQTEPIRREVAIKVVRSGMGSRDVVARFEAERQALALMQHAHIASVIDAGATADGHPYFVMEYVRGVPITTYCERRQLPLRERVDLYRSVCHAIEHAHQKGVIHRDIKPSNLLVEDRDGRPVPKVIDFGIAKAIHRPLTDATPVTRHGSMLGTPAYMSPEQARSDGHVVDTRSDVYALGVVLYELLVGRRPLLHSIEHDRTTLDTNWQRIVAEQEPRRPSVRVEELEPRGRTTRFATRAKALRGDLDWIVMRALEKDPARRYQSASELERDLQRYLRDEPVVAGPPSRLYRLRKSLRKHRAMYVSGTLLFLALVAGMLATLWQRERALGHAARAQRHLEDYRRMADVHLVRDLVSEADVDLWPAWPERREALRSWLARCDRLLERLPLHREHLASLEAGTLRNDQPLAEHERAWQRETLSGLVTNLQELEAGTLRASIERRLTMIDALESVQRHAPATAWAEARRSIADPDECPQYRGLELGKSQTGLVPLGRNPRTGLWEFWHVQSGQRPSWREGRVHLTESDGMVLVLLPGGRTRLGTRKAPEGGRAGPYVDPWARHSETPTYEVDLAPFFLSRFECTQAQWRRWTGENPSKIQRSINGWRMDASDLHPVEHVTWEQAHEALRQMGLCLPTEAQWEYACRAGTDSPFSTGYDVDGLFAHGTNLADEASKAHFRRGWGYDEHQDDGNVLHAKVGSYRSNPFGLFDMHGNVSEWCQDLFGQQELPMHAGTGERIVEDAEVTLRAFRGGNFNVTALAARSTCRNGAAPDWREAMVGLRAARLLDGR
ncbi:MAG: SUMF1/EgtB/PvdO family nonheme iron enzyme [Planctomycetes bacterium]|nr:SUMF1/EgtB/PvdO family nonheme iron enzyme [Planctomycetota bacterium]